MEKMKYLLFTALCIVAISMATACGRDNGTGNRTGNDHSDSSRTTESSYETEETGVVLRDMVDDVERGVDRITE